MPRYDIYKTLANTTANIKLLRAFNPFSIHKKGTRAKAIFALAVVSVLWGTTWIASKEGVRHMPALQLAGIRQIIAGFLICRFFYLPKSTLAERERMDANSRFEFSEFYYE